MLNLTGLARLGNRIGGALTRGGRPRQSVSPDGYDAAQDSPRRRTHSTKLAHEDEHLKPEERRKVVGGTRQAMRNYVILGWMVRHYLNQVTGMTPAFLTKDKGLNKALREWVRVRSLRKNFDHRATHPRRRWMRLAEARRILDGDFAGMKMQSRGLYAIEGDRIREPALSSDIYRGSDGRRAWRHGVRTDANDVAIEYALHRRTSEGCFEFDRFVPANMLIWHAWHEAHYRFDAVRGVSPITSALNSLADFYEVSEFERVKQKAAAMLALVIYSDAEGQIGNTTNTTAVTNEDGDTVGNKYDVQVGQSPAKLELERGDRAEILSANTPAAESVAFMRFCIMVFCKALGIDFSHFDSGHTNFFGNKIAMTFLQQAARAPREDVRDFYQEWLYWQLRWATLPDVAEIVLPRSQSLDSIMAATRWIPDGLPYFDRAREVPPALQAIAGGIDSYSNVIAEQHGMSLDEWLEHLEADQAAISEADVKILNWDKVAQLYADDSGEEITDATLTNQMQ